MSPAKQKPVSPKSRSNKDTFKDLDQAEYRHITAGKPSLFSRIFAKLRITKTSEECKSCWDRLRTRNFQIAGDWYLHSRHSSGDPRVISDVNVAKSRGELGKESEYLETPLNECLQLTCLEAAARYVWYIVKEEGQDPESFVHDLDGVERRVEFVIDLFLSCKFGPETHTQALTKMLFPATRQGDWRRTHLSAGRERSKKRSSKAISKDDSDSEIGDQTTNDEKIRETDWDKRSSLGDAESSSKRSKTRDKKGNDNDVIRDFMKPLKFTSRRPLEVSAVKFEHYTDLQNSDSPIRDQARPNPELAIINSNTASARLELPTSIPKISNPVPEAAQEPEAPIMSPISPTANHNASINSTPALLKDLRESSNFSVSTGTSAPRGPQTVSRDSSIDSVELSRARDRISKLEQEAQRREKTASQLRKRMAEQDEEIKENEERIDGLVAGRAEDNDSLTRRARTIADQDQNLRQFKAEIAHLEQEKADAEQRIANMEQKDIQKSQLIDTLRKTLSDVAGRALQGAREGLEQE